MRDNESDDDDDLPRQPKKDLFTKPRTKARPRVIQKKRKVASPIGEDSFAAAADEVECDTSSKSSVSSSPHIGSYVGGLTRPHMKQRLRRLGEDIDLDSFEKGADQNLAELDDEDSIESDVSAVKIDPAPGKRFRRGPTRPVEPIDQDSFTRAADAMTQPDTPASNASRPAAGPNRRSTRSALGSVTESPNRQRSFHEQQDAPSNKSDAIATRRSTRRSLYGDLASQVTSPDSDRISNQSHRRSGISLRATSSDKITPRSGRTTTPNLQRDSGRVVETSSRERTPKSLGEKVTLTPLTGDKAASRRSGDISRGGKRFASSPAAIQSPTRHAKVTLPTGAGSPKNIRRSGRISNISPKKTPTSGGVVAVARQTERRIGMHTSGSPSTSESVSPTDKLPTPVVEVASRRSDTGRRGGRTSTADVAPTSPTKTLKRRSGHSDVTTGVATPAAKQMVMGPPTDRSTTKTPYPSSRPSPHEISVTPEPVSREKVDQSPQSLSVSSQMSSRWAAVVDAGRTSTPRPTLIQHATPRTPLPITESSMPPSSLKRTQGPTPPSAASQRSSRSLIHLRPRLPLPPDSDDEYEYVKVTPEKGHLSAAKVPAISPGIRDRSPRSDRSLLSRRGKSRPDLVASETESDDWRPAAEKRHQVSANKGHRSSSKTMTPLSRTSTSISRRPLATSPPKTDDVDTAAHVSHQESEDQSSEATVVWENVGTVQTSFKMLSPTTTSPAPAKARLSFRNNRSGANISSSASKLTAGQKVSSSAQRRSTMPTSEQRKRMSVSPELGDSDDEPQTGSDEHSHTENATAVAATTQKSPLKDASFATSSHMSASTRHISTTSQRGSIPVQPSTSSKFFPSDDDSESVEQQSDNEDSDNDDHDDDDHDDAVDVEPVVEESQLSIAAASKSSLIATVRSPPITSGHQPASSSKSRMPSGRSEVGKSQTASQLDGSRRTGNDSTRAVAGSKLQLKQQTLPSSWLMSAKKQVVQPELPSIYRAQPSVMRYLKKDREDPLISDEYFGFPAMTQEAVEGKRALPKKKARNAESTTVHRRRVPAPKWGILPLSFIRSNFEFFLQKRVSREVALEVHKQSDTYMVKTIKLAAEIARKEGTRTITKAHLLRVLERQDIVNEERTIEDLIITYMPMEVREKLIPCAQPGNIVKPEWSLTGEVYNS